MPIIVTPELGIPLPFDTTPEEIDDFREKARALFQTVEVLAQAGLAVEITDEDRQVARQAALTGKLPAVQTTHGSIVHLESILTEWDQEVLDVGRRLRNYVTNKLIIESTDEDPKVRLRALEQLGKISNVGLFSDRIDISVTHRTITDIESDLRRTLELYGGNVIDVTPVGAPKALDTLDLDEEFGFDTPLPKTTAELEPESESESEADGR
jgi:hypothetical protein